MSSPSMSSRPSSSGAASQSAMVAGRREDDVDMRLNPSMPALSAGLPRGCVRTLMRSVATLPRSGPDLAAVDDDHARRAHRLDRALAIAGRELDRAAAVLDEVGREALAHGVDRG